MNVALARVPAARLLRTRRGLGSALSLMGVALVTAIVAKSHGQTSGADHVMRGVFASLIVPLVSYALVGASLGGAGMRKGIRGVVMLGAEPRRAAITCTVVAMLASVVVVSLLAAAMCLIAHGPTDPPLARDVPASMFVGGLGSATYAAYFACGSCIAKGTFRAGFLAFDWIIGGLGGVGAALTPRGHVLALAGGPLCLEMPRLASTLFLFVLLGAYLGLTAALSRRAV